MYVKIIAFHFEDCAFIIITKKKLLKVLSSKPREIIKIFVNYYIILYSTILLIESFLNIIPFSFTWVLVVRIKNRF